MMRPIPVRLSDNELAAIDGLRGDTTRSAFMRAAVLALLADVEDGVDVSHWLRAATVPDARYAATKKWGNEG